MPQKNRYKKPSCTARAITKNRAEGPKVNGQPGRQGEGVDTVIADSFHSVKFKDKPGTLVFFALRGHEANEEKLGDVYEAAKTAYHKVLLLTKGEVTNYDPLKNGLTFPTSLFSILDALKRLIPKPFEFNIDFIEKGAYVKGRYIKEDLVEINVFAECDSWAQHSYIEVGPVLLKLFKEKKGLHDLFVQFLKLMNAHGIDLWCDGSMGHDLEMMEEKVLNWEGEVEDLIQYKSEVIKYKSGDPAKYIKLIKKGKPLPAVEIMKRAKRYKAGHPIANLIFQGCQVLNNDYNLSQFSYYLPHEDYNNSCFLELEATMNIIWQEGDALSSDYGDSLGAYAQEGVQRPTIYQTITKDLKELDFDKLKIKAGWIMDLTRFFSRAEELTKKYLK